MCNYFSKFSSYSIDRINKKIIWGKNFAFLNQNDTAHKLRLENKILSAELQIAKHSINRIFDNVQPTYTQDQKKFRVIGDVEIDVISPTYGFSLTTKCKPKWSRNSFIGNFARKWNKIQRNKKSKENFKN